MTRPGVHTKVHRCSICACGCICMCIQFLLLIHSFAFSYTIIIYTYIFTHICSLQTSMSFDVLLLPQNLRYGRYAVHTVGVLCKGVSSCILLGIICARVFATLLMLKRENQRKWSDPGIR